MNCACTSDSSGKATHVCEYHRRAKMWQSLYETLAHGDESHRAWLRGMVQGFASALEGYQVEVKA